MATGNRLSVALTVPELTDREGLLKSASRSKVPNLKVDNLAPPVHHIVQTVDLTEGPEKPKRRRQLDRTVFSQSLDHSTAHSVFDSSPFWQTDEVNSKKEENGLNHPGLRVTLSTEDNDSDGEVNVSLSQSMAERKLYLDRPQKQSKSGQLQLFHQPASLSQDNSGISFSPHKFEKHPLRRSKNPHVKGRKAVKFDGASSVKDVRKAKCEPTLQKAATLPAGQSPSVGSPLRSNSKKNPSASDIAEHIAMDMIDIHFRNFQIELSMKPIHWLESYKDKHWTDVTCDTKGVDESEKSRRNKVWELFHTEVVYFTTQLQPLKMVYRDFLLFLQRQSPPVLKGVNVNRIFGNLDDVYDLSVQVAMDLLKLFKLKSSSEVATVDDLVSAFGMFGRKFNPVYQTYGLNFESAKEFRESLNQYPLFAKYIKLSSSDMMCKRLKLEDFLLAPVKHLAHYPMLLEKIVKYTVGAGRKSLLQSALHAFKVSLKELESNMDDYKRILRLNEVQKVIHWPTVAEMGTNVYIPQTLRFKLSEQPCERLLLSGHQTILHEGKLTLIGSKGQKFKKLHGMLFHDFLLLTESTKQKKMSVYKQPFPLSEMTVYDVDEEEVKRSFACLVSNKFNQHVGLLVLQTKTLEEKSTWMERIRTGVEDFELV